jgi:hypothetical protein
VIIYDVLLGFIALISSYLGEQTNIKVDFVCV